MRGSYLQPILWIAACCFLAVIPFFWLGIPSGHDFEFHMFSWLDVVSQWKQGVFYPRWASLAHWGYGEARFLFYPPASWSLGAALGAFLPWNLVPGAYIWLVLSAAGLSMYRLVRSWLTPSSAIFAAIFYALNPYHLLIVYWRSAYAELFAAILLPLVLLCVLRSEEANLRPGIGLGLVLAGAWLTNEPAAVMIHYSTALFAAGLAVSRRSWRPLRTAAVGIAIGAGLAAFYLVPAVYEEKWVNIAQVLAPGVRPLDNFAFTTIGDPDHNRFNLLVSVVVASQITGFAFCIWLSRKWMKESKPLYVLTSLWGVASALVMFRFTNIFWEHLPELRFVQLPWRWLLCLNAALAILLPFAVRSWRARAGVAAAMLIVLVMAGYRIQPPWWDTSDDIEEMRYAVATGAGYEGTDEYVPFGADAYELIKDAPRIVHSPNNPAQVSINSWRANLKRFMVVSDRSDTLTLHLLNYPAWQVKVNGKPTTTRSTRITGQMMISVPAGRNGVEVRFVRTLDRAISGLVSLFSLGIVTTMWIMTRRKRAIGNA